MVDAIPSQIKKVRKPRAKKVVEEPNKVVEEPKKTYAKKEKVVEKPPPPPQQPKPLTARQIAAMMKNLR